MVTIESDVLKGFNNQGNFINNNSEYCQLSYYYEKDKKMYKIYFMQPNIEIATRPAITTTSLKKVVKLLESENFKLTDLK